MIRNFLAVFVGVFICLLAACKHEPFKVVTPTGSDNFPPEISKIIVTKCATAGCHNDLSYQVSGGGLLLDTWEHLFDGGNTGAAVVAYAPDISPILYFTNTFPDLGPIPADNMKMPLNNPALSRAEYLTLREWILKGAPDKNGNIPFATNAANRQKVYASHEGCDFVTVIDAEKNVVMRSIPVGKILTIEAAYSLKTHSDDHAYVSFWAGQYLQKINMKTDSVDADIDLGVPNSNIVFAAADNNDVLVTNLYRANLMRVNPGSGQVRQSYGGNFFTPHGITANRSFDTFFVTEQFGNMLYRIPSTGPTKIVSIDGNAPTTNSSGPNPYNIQMSPDYSKYFLTCQGSNEIRVMDAYTDALIKVIKVGTSPKEMTISRKKPYLFVSCSDDTATIPLFKGSVYIIDYNTLEVVKKINDRYFMPHALAVDDQHHKLFVFSRNIDPNGPAPHHNSATCGGRNGYYSIYDFEKLQPLNNKRYEVIVDPFATDVRFK